MKKDYKTVTRVSILQQKEFLLKICQKEDITEYLCQCMTKKQIKDILSYPNIHAYLLQRAIETLYQVQNYEDMEYVLFMMNSLFHDQEYIEIKKSLFLKLFKQHTTLEIYCVLRHLIYLPQGTFPMFVEQLHRNGSSLLECAKFCLIEDNYHLAYEYLQKLDYCEDEVVLDLLASYSLCDYISLKRNYAKKKKEYCLTIA